MAKQNPKFTRKVLTSYTIEGEYTNNGTIVTDDGEERDLLADLQTFNNCYIKITVKQVEEEEEFVFVFYLLERLDFMLEITLNCLY